MSGSAARPRGRARRFAVVAAGVAAALALVAAFAPALLGAPWMRETILRWLNRSPDRQVGFADLSVSWKDGIRLDGVTVTDLRGGAHRPFLEADEVAIDVAWKPLLSKRIVASAFTVRGAVVDLTQPTPPRAPDAPPTRLPEGAFGLASARVPVTITDAVVKFRHAEARVRNARMLVRVEEDAVVADSIEAEVNGGRVTGTARIELGGADPSHRMELHAKDVVLDDALAPLVARAVPLLAGSGGEGGMRGRAGLELRAQARGRTLDEIVRSVAGDGVVALDGVEVPARPWLVRVLALLGREADRVALEPARVPFRVVDERVRAEDSEIRSNVFVARVGGVVGLDGTLDARLRIRPAGRVAAFERVAAWLDPEGFLPLRLTGNVSSPEVALPGAGHVLGEALRRSGAASQIRRLIDEALRR